MKKLPLVTLPLFFSLCLVHLVFGEEIFIDKNDPEHIDKILATDPSTLSEKQFYKCEFAMVSGYSGSGGHFIDEPLIEWLKMAEKAFEAKGIKLKDKHKRHFVFADSYFNGKQYEKALEEYRNMKDREGIELAEWFISNKEIKNGVVKIKEYLGKIPCTASEITRTKNKEYLFVAYFKGPVYRYDNKKRMHAIIFAPEDKYDWCDALAFDGRNLIIKLRDYAGTFIFNNNTHEITQLVSSYDVSLNQVAIFYGAYFYDLPEDSWVEGLRYSTEKGKLAVSVKYKKEDDSITHKTATINRDGTNIQEINAESFAEFSQSETSELPTLLETRLKEFIQRRFEPHAGALGGFVKYEIVNVAFSPDKSKLAFMIKGDDGHATFYPSIYIADREVRTITRIDSTSSEMCKDIIWISNNEIMYVKDARLWKAVIK